MTANINAVGHNPLLAVYNLSFRFASLRACVQPLDEPKETKRKQIDRS
jgi:hypothetical protein